MNDAVDLAGGLLGAAYAHATAEQPRECCGLLVRLADGGGLVYMAAQNVYPGQHGEDRFRVDPGTWAAAEDAGEIAAVVHSHVNESANPSMADRAGCEKSGLPWFIVGWPSGVVKRVDPCGWQAPYKGRQFAHGVMDCYALIQDWYLRELQLELPDFERDDDWWVPAADGQVRDLYMDGFAQAGFERMPAGAALERHDVILMQVRSPRGKANHGAVYLGNGVILHHLAGRPSCEDVYGGYWLDNTLAVLRHGSRLAAAAALAA